MRFEVPDGCLHRLCTEENFGHDQLVVVEEAAHLGHPIHEWTIDDIQRCVVLQGFVQIIEQPILRALDDIDREALLQRQGNLRFA